jgi:FeS assembly SUF system protein
MSDTTPPVPQTVPQPVAETAQGPPSLDDRITAALKTVYDPEIPVDIYELGLIYDVAISEQNHVHLKMTLTSPACPVAGSLPGDVEQKVAGVSGVESCEVELVWDPAWNPEMMSEAAKLELGFF